MIVADKQIFNLMNTNGRRSDVVNALKIYLEILQELNITHPNEKWDRYPNSTKQIMFYEKAIELSKDVFKIHKNYDLFLESVGDDYEKLLERNKDWLQSSFTEYADVVDESIEQRSRHYTSNLVKIGFTDSDRKITDPGYAFLNNKVARDEFETLLPIGDTNIVLIRQLLKLKIFSTPDSNGNRTFYSPFLMALFLLLADNNIDKSEFSLIIQGLNPYNISNAIDKASSNVDIDKLIEEVNSIKVKVPDEIIQAETLTKSHIKKHFKTSKKSYEMAEVYYDFYTSLKCLLENQTEDNYNKLLCELNKNSEYLRKAFGYGSNVFKVANKNKEVNVNEFFKVNKNNKLLQVANFNENFYTSYILSKNADGIREYSDTTIRLLGASGLFKFRNLPELAHKNIIKLIFSKFNIKSKIYGTMSEKEFKEYETNSDAYLYKNSTISEILEYNEGDCNDILENILTNLDVTSIEGAKASLISDTNVKFTSYIKENYPKERVVELLKLFSDRKNDNKLKREVNESAPVPTIYEYIVAIAWFYISNTDFDLYDSMNLTLNADFEPVTHAGGGATSSDIVIKYEKSIVVLEVTLMNKQAQKRGEWEPVLRHSLNIKADNPHKEAITFFVADELDMNTINIWRAVAAAPLESTNTHEKVDGVIIMPLTNAILVDFLIKNIYKEAIINATKESFAKVPKITDVDWHEDIMSALIK